jgi:broad specificity phosphatase PhoE
MRDTVTLYIIRHGETDWNAELRYQGQRDVPLNDKGRSQAQRNGRALASLMPRIGSADFVSSPLGRARDTMRIVRRELGLDPQEFQLDARLQELSYGAWEGQLQSTLAEVDPQGWSERLKDPFRWRPAGGESYADLQERIAHWVDGLERDTVAASHGGVSRCLRGHVLGLDPLTVPELESPQDRILVLTRQGMRWL